METPKHKTIKGTQFWLPLDNAAKIFPATITNEVTTVFRLSVVLKNPVKIQALMKSLSLADKRFPYYKVRLTKGFFWYYLEHIDRQLPVEVDNKEPCRRFPENRLLMRILVKRNRLSVECSHILTDGGGIFEFFKTILALYFKECGADLPADFNFMHPNDDINEEEYEDAYKRYFKEEIPPIIRKTKAFHLPFDINPSPRLKISNVIVSINEIKQKANEKNLTITDYLVAVYLYALQEIHEEQNAFSRSKKNKPIRIQVPVNLRKIFPSNTMRNFSLFVMPEIDLRLGHYTFEEITRRVYHQIRLETDEKLISKNISRNVGSERKIYVKSIPLFLKSLILRMKYYSLGTSQYSGVLTNLGLVKLPPEIENKIEYFTITAPPPNKMLKVNCGVIGFKNILVLSFGNITKSKMLENKILEFLKRQGIKANFNEDNI